MPKISELTDEQAQEIFQNPEVLNAFQNRLEGLVGAPSDYIASLPKAVKRRLRALENVQDENNALEVKFQDELLALKKKYAGLHAPLYEKRQKIVSGDYEPTDKECEREEPEIEEEEQTEKDESVKGVPEFWATILRNSPEVSELITERDDEALKHLTNVRYEYIDSDHGFKLFFHFSANEFFSNEVLTKTYHLTNDGTNYGDIMFESAEGCEIQWKDGKNLTVTVETKKQRHKGTNKTRVVKKTVPTDSFFNFFKPPQPPKDDDEVEMTEEDYEELEQAVESDYAIGEIIKEKLIPQAIQWFTGEALQFEEDYGHYDDEDDEDDLDDEAEEEDDDDDDDEGTQPKPECKQQ